MTNQVRTYSDEEIATVFGLERKTQECKVLKVKYIHIDFADDWYLVRTDRGDYSFAVRQKHNHKDAFAVCPRRYGAYNSIHKIEKKRADELFGE